MKVGIAIFATAYAIRIDELARETEARGFESLWTPEHTHIPADRRGPTGDTLPDHYVHSLDPFVALTAAAAATTRLQIGTGVCLLIQRDPIATAKAVSTLDHLSGGRFLFGIGGGWNVQEMADHGTDYRTRWRLLKERVTAMKALWTQEVASFEGDFVRFGPSLSYPKPVQKPHPPILLGNNGPRALERVVDYCDGWFPLQQKWADLGEAVRRLRSMAEAAGRDPDSISVTVSAATPSAENLEMLDRLGVERAVVYVPSEGRETVLPLLDGYARDLLPSSRV